MEAVIVYYGKGDRATPYAYRFSDHILYEVGQAFRPARGETCRPVGVTWRLIKQLWQGKEPAPAWVNTVAAMAKMLKDQAHAYEGPEFDTLPRASSYNHLSWDGTRTVAGWLGLRQHRQD